MVTLPFRRISKGKPSLRDPRRFNRKLDPKREKEIIKRARREFKKINIDTEKLLKESKNLGDIKKIEKIVKKDLNEIKKYIKYLKGLYGASLNINYPEIIRLEELIDKLYKILEEIKKKGPSMNLEKEYHIILNDIHKLWETHKHKISKT